MSDFEDDSYFGHDVWIPASERGVPNRVTNFLELEQAWRTPPKSARGSGPGLPFRIREFQFAREPGSMNLEEGNFVVAQSRPRDQLESSGPPSSWRFLPPLFAPEEEVSAPADDQAWCDEVCSEEASAIMDAMRETLESRDAEGFAAARAALNEYALKIPMSAVEQLDDAVRLCLGEAWWAFADEDPEGAELFQQEHLGSPFYVGCDTAPSTVTSMNTSVMHTIMGAGGINLGPRFRTRQIQYASADLVMKPP